MVLAVFVLLLGIAAWLRLYDAGQLVHDKSRLTQGADAAAYSGALAQARALNLLAHINRAQVAHQVAMAHLVTYASAAQFVQTEGARAALRNPPTTLVGMLFGPAHGAAYASALAGRSLAAPAMLALSAAFAEHDRVVNDVLWQAQRAIVASLPATRWAAMQAVLGEHYAPGSAPGGTEFVLDPAFLDDGLPGFVAARQGAARADMRELVLAATARYGFLQPRDATARNAWVVSPRCPAKRHELRRRGATRWEGYDTWASADTQSYHALRSNRWIGCYFREYPMGWGHTGSGQPAAPEQHVETPPTDFGAQDFWRWVREHTDWDIAGGSGNPLATSYGHAARVRWPARGLPGYMGLAVERADGPLRFAIRALRPASSIPTLDRASQVAVGGRWPGGTRLPGGALAAVSAAETYFVRPQARADGRDEAPNLFHPYWQARLVPVSPAEAAEARRRQEGA
ncbi:hypothetical protein GCM10025795_25430 [Verticiella sediminum]